MREIRFRAWADGKMWDSYVVDDNGEMCTNGDYCNGPENNSNKKIVMQFTGLKDKNGKEIYEGDIIKYGDGGVEERFQIRLVYFDKGSFVVDDDVYFSGDLSPIVLSCFACNDEEDGDECEVIGNIYENPELLESKEAKK